LPITPDLPNDALLVLLESAYVTYINGKRDDTMLQWIAACAVSPILHWDWTLHIARIIDKGAKNLLSLENLFQINRLPWFIAGKMPENVRLTLLDWLEKNHPETLMSVRKEWQQVLESEQNTPPSDSLAFEEHRIQILFNEWQLNKKMPQKKFDELENLLRHNDETLVVEFLRRTPTALDTLVPPKFRKYVRDNTGFIPKTKAWINDLGWILPIVFLLGTALWLFQPNGKDCVGKTFLYQNQTYCLNSPQDSLIMFETLLCDNMKKLHYKLEDLKNKLEEAAPNKKLDTTKSVYKFFVGQTEIDSSKVYFDEIYLNMLLKLMRTNRLDSASMYKNIGLAYYNTAVQFYNDYKKDSACIFYNKLNSWAWRDSVTTAQELEKLKSICINAIPVIQPNAPIQIPKKIVPTSKPTPVKTPPVVVPPNAHIQQTKQETIPAQKANAGSELKLPATHPVNAQQTKQNQPVNLPNALPTKKDTVFKDPFEGQMVYVQGGTFQMGCDDKKDGNCESIEKPVHAVTLSDFSIGKYEVTQKQWKAVMGENNNPSKFKGDDLPVENVSWEDTQIFLQKLKEKTNKQYRLPTEAEWEFAARGGNKSKNYKYSGSNNLDAVAWYNNNSKSETHPVGKLQANELGIYDMSGNVTEWGNDLFETYSASPMQNPTGPIKVKNSYRVYRGGSRYSTAQSCRAAFRYYSGPEYGYEGVGFRVAVSISSFPSSK
jgi:formylglycine-generating enzyme required for sulfatase activity